MKGLRGRRAIRTERRPRLGWQAFTLVELLVVIAIIVVLIAIALPVFQGARERARQTACMANLHQLAMGVRMYRMDMGFYPGPYDPATGEGGLNALYPAYVSSRKVFACPDDLTDSGDKYVNQKVRIYTDATTYHEVAYSELLSAASTIYAETDPQYFLDLWQYSITNPPSDAPRDPSFFTEHYSSYNDLYNWVGYAYFPREYLTLKKRWQTDAEWFEKFTYSLCDLSRQQFRPGDNLAYWYMWYRWDPENTLGVWGSPDVYALVTDRLQYHLAQQTYWDGYDPNNLDQQQYRLQDGLRRTLWDPGNPDEMPYGMPSPVFPGLINRNAPDNTIITRCKHHRPYTMTAISPSERIKPGGPGESTTTTTLDRSPQDIVLRLDGSAALRVGINYDWAVQPQSQ